MSDLPILPTTVVGSHGKPGWWHACKDLHDEGAWGPYDLAELLDDATDVAILDQERAGVDIISDGESRRLDGYVDGYYGVIDGIRALPTARHAGPWGYDQQTRYEAMGKINAPTGLGIVQEFEYLNAHTQNPTKVTCAGPLTFGSRIRPNNFYSDTVAVAEEFAHVINTELKALVDAGAAFFIQIDEPARGNVTGAEMARLFQPRHGGRGGQAGLSHLLRQPLRQGAVPAPLRQLLSRRPGSARRPVRAGVRQPRDGRN